MKKRVFEIRVPATTANLGPGFDSLGMAMQIYNTVTVTVGGDEGIEITGYGADELPRDESNLMIRSAMILAEAAEQKLPPMHWQAHHDIPLARGMGSSSAAIVAGLLATDAALELGLDEGDLGPMAAEIEGHPDNVVPAILGGMTLWMPDSDPPRGMSLFPDRELRLALLVPDYQLSTESMRQALPEMVPMADAVFNLSRSAAMVMALQDGMWGILREACRDKLHQPYRMPLMKGMDAIFAAAYKAGAHGVAVSGSGPTAAAFCTLKSKAIGRAMLAAASKAGVPATAVVTRLDYSGATVTQKE